jgi:hypothetical protein
MRAMTILRAYERAIEDVHDYTPGIQWTPHLRAFVSKRRRQYMRFLARLERVCRMYDATPTSQKPAGTGSGVHSAQIAAEGRE